MNYLWFVLLASFWGGSFVAIKVAVGYFPPFFDAFLRVGFSLIILWIIFYKLKKNLHAPFAIRKKIWLVGLFAQGIPFAFLFWGERFISPGLAGILNGTVPIWAFIFNLCFNPEHDSSSRKIFGLLLGIAGVIIIFSPFFHFSGHKQELIGTAAVLCMAISYAIGGFLSQQFFKTQKDFFHVNVFHQHCASVLLLLLLSLSFETWPAWSILKNAYSLWISVGYLALFSTALAWLMYFWLIQEWGIVRASTVTYISPIMAIFLDFLFFRNTPNATEIIGIITILMGVILIQIPKKQLLSLFGKRQQESI